MFTFDDGNLETLYFPTIYLLYLLEKLPSLSVYLNQGVEEYICNGADLMWPGVHSITREDYISNKIAVIYAHKDVSEDGTITYAPVGVGLML